ncbi:MAG: hypothetical protein VX871_05335, partial [Pseudomonadota bacterium]|nr:hypothetical protein [Pseudomonadota bacterium]
MDRRETAVNRIAGSSADAHSSTPYPAPGKLVAAAADFVRKQAASGRFRGASLCRRPSILPRSAAALLGLHFPVFPGFPAGLNTYRQLTKVYFVLNISSLKIKIRFIWGMINVCQEKSDVFAR